MDTKSLTPLQARQKIRHYCAYQERCHSEVRRKLYDYGLTPPEVDALVAELITENYLNEERFAVQFAGGHFRVKRWGKVRIRRELELRKVSAYCIRVGLASIDGDDYEATIRRLIEQKSRELTSVKHPALRQKKLVQYLLQKGYELELVLSLIGRSND